MLLTFIVNLVIWNDKAQHFVMGSELFTHIDEDIKVFQGQMEALKWTVHHLFAGSIDFGAHYRWDLATLPYIIKCQKDGGHWEQFGYWLFTY